MQVTAIAPARGRVPGRLGFRLPLLATFGVLFTLVVILQWRTGAFTAEFSGYPDEASHYMSGLLVHDYVAAAFPERPMTFARQFYLHYPYLAIGHWPPAFYAVEGVWMLLFSPSRLSVMLLMAVITSLLALVTYRVVSEEFGAVTAWITVVALVSTRLVVQYTAMVMLETPLALLCFLAVIYFGRFLDSGRWQDSAKFAALAALAMMTKANAAELALVIPFGLLVCRRVYLVKRWAFWLPTVIAVLICAPWHLATMHLILPTFTADEGFRFTTRALKFFIGALAQVLGAGFGVLALAGFFDRVIRPLRKNGVEPKWAMMAGLPLAVVIFHSLVSAGLEKRYLVTAIPPLLPLCAAGARFLGDRVRVGSLSVAWRQQMILFVALLISVGEAFPIQAKTSFGFEAAADRIMSDPLLRNSLILVSSETNAGEGILVSEIALHRQSEPPPVVLRASKVLAENGWNQSLDNNYRPLLPDAAAVEQCLDQSGVRLVVLDSSPGPKTYQHHREILEMLQRHPEHWTLVGSYGAKKTGDSRGGVQVYIAAPTNSGKEIDPLQRIRTNLDDRLQNWPIVERLTCTANGAMSSGSGR